MAQRFATPRSACKPRLSSASREVIHIDMNVTNVVIGICMLMATTILLVLKIIEVARSK